MKRLIREICKAEVNTKLLALGTAMVLLGLLLPIMRIMQNCVPWYDDFGYGLYTKKYWMENHSFIDAIKGALYNVKSSWYSWQGTYTSCFFMSLMPATWGTDKYAYGLWAILLTLVLSVFCFVKVLLKDVIKCEDKWICLTVQAIVAATVVLFMRSAIEGFFWYNSAVHYTGMHSLGILYIAGLIKLVYSEGGIKRYLLFLVSVLGALIVGGVNNVTALQVGLVILSIIGVGAIFRNKKVLLLLPAVACYAFALYKNMGAPGNAKRMVFYSTMKLSPVETIFRSFQSAVTYLWDFTGWMTLAIIVLMVPIVLYIVSKSEFCFRFPGLVALWSFCLYATGFTPTLYTMGHTLLGRATNMAKVTFQILLFINLFYFLGWLYQYLKGKNITLPVRNTWCFYIVMIIIMVAIFALEPNKGGKYSSYCAYYFVHTGEAYNYYNEYLERVEICENGGPDVVVKPYVYKPWLLCLGDLSEDPNYEPNRFMANYFNKNSIICVAPTEDGQE